MVAEVGPLVRELERRDPDLARQCRRALSSAPLNVCEGSYSRGANRNAPYQNATGSLREVRSCFEVAAALGYVAPLRAEMVNRFDHVIGTLVKIPGRR
ncbi:MAG: four helix bundle protein [Polyangiaceae bacterium]